MFDPLRCTCNIYEPTPLKRQEWSFLCVACIQFLCVNLHINVASGKQQNDDYYLRNHNHILPKQLVSPLKVVSYFFHNHILKLTDKNRLKIVYCG